MISKKILWKYLYILVPLKGDGPMHTKAIAHQEETAATIFFCYVVMSLCVEVQNVRGSCASDAKKMQ